MVNQGGKENARIRDQVAVNHHLVFKAVADHGKEDAEIPDRADQQDPGEKIMVEFSAPGKHEHKYGAIQQKAKQRNNSGNNQDR